MKTVIAAFAERATADEAKDQLESAGIQPASFRIVEPSAADKVLDTFPKYGVPADRAQLYAEFLRRGGTLDVAMVEDEHALETAELFDRAGSLDLDRAGERWRAAGWKGYDRTARPYSDSEIAGERAALGRDLEVIQEEVRIGKREVPRGGMRVHSYVVERPVKEQVELREERIDVSRERVDEPIPAAAADAAFAAGKEDEYVVTAKGEEPVVEKQARVVERVRVEKKADTREETIEETERRREVEVEPVEPNAPSPRH